MFEGVPIRITHVLFVYATQSQLHGYDALSLYAMLTEALGWLGAAP